MTMENKEQLEKDITCEDEEREKANQALGELIEVLSKYKLRVQDLVVVYGNLGYAIGAAIEGYNGQEGPGLEELQKRYYSNPSIGVAMMLQGMLVTSWYDQVIQSQQSKTDSNKEKK